MTLKLPLRNTVAKQLLKPLLMVTSNADWEYDLRRTVWRALRVQWWPMRWLLLIMNSLMVKKVTCLSWSETVKDKLRLWSDPVCWWITVSVVFTTLTGFLGAYCGIIGLDWMLENWHGNIWEDLEDPKNTEPLNLIESPLPAQEIFPSLSNETVLFLIEDAFSLEGVALPDEASSLHPSPPIPKIVRFQHDPRRELAMTKSKAREGQRTPGFLVYIWKTLGSLCVNRV